MAGYRFVASNRLGDRSDRIVRGKADPEVTHACRQRIGPGGEARGYVPQ